MIREPVFKDRKDAGRQLAQQLERYREADPIILGLPRGGVVLAYEVARALDAPLDVVVTRKLGHPNQPELAIGAVAPGGILLIEHRHGLTDEDIERLASREMAEMERRVRRFRGVDRLPDVQGRTAIVVDDGIATGATALAAVYAVRRKQPKRIVLAAGVCAKETAAYLEEEVDDLVCVSGPELLFAIGEWYQDFRPVTDEAVVALLEKARQEAPVSQEGENTLMEK